jgi:UDP-N-acetylglucosamine--N-acetylmuramyl-(pentapeptide) pyrophosphoryl-undecaprenol N-acetylglucosamine transferase
VRVILAGGGTGGHLFPGLAVARELERRDPTTEIMFVGTSRGIEARVLPREGFPLVTLPVRGIQGRGARGWLQALYAVPASLLRSLGILRRFRPDLVIGLGGYASGPLVLAAKALGLRAAILEQNVAPGLTNRVLGRLVDRVFVAYPESLAHFPPGKAIVVGNPVRWSELPEVRRDEKFTVVVFGGSAGAHRLNVATVDAARRLNERAQGLRLIHQTGEADRGWVLEAYRTLPLEVEVHAFIERMDEAYARADLVVCRAGATTIAELTALGKAAILVPYPYAAEDHQRRNAEALAAAGAAEVILDAELTGSRLAEAILALASDRQRIRAMEAAARRLGNPGAAAAIAEHCRALGGPSRESSG